MPTYKLIYFNARGRGELIRYVFAQAGVQYEDFRVSKEKWAEIKPTTPYGMLPVLEEDGKQVAGGVVAARYLAEKPEFGLAGSNAFENAQIASIVDVMEDFVKEVFKVHFEKDEARKAELMKAFLGNAIPKYLGILNTLLVNNSGYLWGGKLTWADLYLANVVDFLYRDPIKDAFSPYPEITKLRDRVDSQPNMAKWLKERPVTEN